MFTCANEKVTFVIKNTYRHCNWSAYLKPRNIKGASRPTCQKHSMRDLGKNHLNNVCRLCFGRFPSILFLFIALNRLQFCTMTSFITPCKGIGILESRVSLWNPELVFGKRNTAQGARNPIKDWIHEAIYN